MTAAVRARRRDNGGIDLPTRKATAKDIIWWIETKCYVPEGRLIGRPFKLAPWQRDALTQIYDNPAGTRRAVLSFGRKNGKTALASLLLLVHLCGPKYVPNSQLFSTATAREQAALIFHLAAKIVRMSPILRDVVQIKEAAKELICPDLGTRYRALSAEATTAFGLSPVFVVHDELGQVRGPRSALYEAMETATGAVVDPLAVIISTQAPTDADLLSILIDDAMAGHDPRTICQLYTAPKELDPFDPETIKLANPAFGDFLNPTEILAMAADAKRMPSREAEYRNLILNQRVQTDNPFVAPEIWAQNGGLPGGLEGVELYGGLDLSQTADLTALVLIGKREDGKWGVHPTFWLPEGNLIEKSVADRVPYDRWAHEGFLTTTPGNSIKYQWVANVLRELFSIYSIRKIGFDRWQFEHLKAWLLQAGLGENFIKDRFVEFGQGYASMSPALRALEEVLRDGNMAHGNNPVLGMCVSNTVITLDDAGNRKPSKRKSVGRIDGLVALAMAAGVAPLAAPKIDIEALIG
jgi:phage terminase large subunit-like protein